MLYHNILKISPGKTVSVDLRTGQTVLRGVGQSREGVGHQFVNPWEGGSLSFQLPMGVGHPVLWQELVQIVINDNRGNSFQLQRTKYFRAVPEKLNLAGVQ